MSAHLFVMYMYMNFAGTQRVFATALCSRPVACSWLWRRLAGNTTCNVIVTSDTACGSFVHGILLPAC